MAKKSCGNQCNSELDVNIVKCEPEIINEIENNITNEIEVVCECESGSVQVCGNFIYYLGKAFLNICEINYTEPVGNSGKFRIYFNNQVGLEVMANTYEQIIAKLTIN